jgi:hypothetical protein
VARLNPIAKIKDTAIDTLKGSVSVTHGAVGQVGQVVGKALGTVETVASLVPGLKRDGKDDAKDDDRTATDGPDTSPAGPAASPERAAAPTEPAGSRKVHGDVLAPVAKKAAGKKAPAKQAPAKQAETKKAAAQPAPVTKAVPPAAKKAPAAKTPAKKAPAKKTAAPTAAPDDVTPADLAKQVAKKAPAKKAPAKKAAKKPAPPAEPLASDEPTAEVVYSTGPDSDTPGTTAAPGAGSSSGQPLIDPGTAKAILSEAETLARAADPDKG